MFEAVAEWRQPSGDLAAEPVAAVFAAAAEVVVVATVGLG